MGKYFGTDGVRGIANTELTPELAFRIGRCGGYVLTRNAQKPKVLIGRDTRVSGSMLEAALAAGLTSIGADVIQLGVVSTPAVAFLTRQMGADAGVMISASHNPVEDNGIKFFGSDGFKLLDEKELEIEQLLDAAEDVLPRPVGGDLGSIESNESAGESYVDFVKSTVGSGTPFAGKRVVLDCANGAAYLLAPRIFHELGAEVIVIGAEPDGRNINANCGSTHPEQLQAAVVAHNADIGLAFDGDADRLIAVDETGAQVDGDYILSICGDAMNRAGKLANGTIVTTVMANIGFFKGIEAAGMQAVQTAVGDRYVMEEMRRGGYNLGGEQSGHVIFLEYSTTGDGIMTAVQLMQTLVQSGRKLSELTSIMRKYPQVLVNVRVADKSKLQGNAEVERVIREVEDQLGDNGRVLVRPSGTESLIRVMAEGPEKEQVEAYVNQIVKVVEEQLS